MTAQSLPASDVPAFDVKFDAHLKCSFAANPRIRLRKLIAGPGVYICDECIDLCNEILMRNWWTASNGVRPPTPAAGGTSGQESGPHRPGLDANLQQDQELPDEQVVGEAARVMSVAVYNHYKRLAWRETARAKPNRPPPACTKATS